MLPIHVGQNYSFILSSPNSELSLTEFAAEEFHNMLCTYTSLAQTYIIYAKHVKQICFIYAYKIQHTYNTN
jgi:hypothetical protein